MFEKRDKKEPFKKVHMPNAAWAWEFLRRNKDYRNDFSKEHLMRPSVKKFRTGNRLIVGESRYHSARKWGLLFFADPDFTYRDTDVFWKPSVFPATVRVRLGEPQEETNKYNRNFGGITDSVFLTNLCCRCTLFESINNSRHIVLNARRYWFQLYCDSPHPIDDQAVIRFRIDGGVHSKRRMKTVHQLLDLHRSIGGKIGDIGTRKNVDKLQSSLIALDLNEMGGSYQDIAVSLFGEKRVLEDWSTSGCSLKESARRTLERGRKFRDGGYLTLLG